ncbi:MAG: helix-turn-helix domain-containing protein [bacterium]
MNPLLIKLGERIRTLRKAKNISQETLAEKADLHTTYLGQIERAEVNASINTIYKIALALGISLSELFTFLSDEESTIKSNLLLSEIIQLSNKTDEETIKIISKILKDILYLTTVSSHTIKS